jgi:hypothetical protein
MKWFIYITLAFIALKWMTGYLLAVKEATFMPTALLVSEFL